MNRKVTVVGGAGNTTLILSAARDGTEIIVPSARTNVAKSAELRFFMLHAFIVG